jgi:hypothetical protein
MPRKTKICVSENGRTLFVAVRATCRAWVPTNRSQLLREDALEENGIVAGDHLLLFVYLSISEDSKLSPDLTGPTEKVALYL